jgi:FtsK/SpoIIIE family
MADRLGWVRSTGPAGLPPMVQRTPLQPRSPETRSYQFLVLLGRPAWAYRVELASAGLLVTAWSLLDRVLPGMLAVVVVVAGVVGLRSVLPVRRFAVRVWRRGWVGRRWDTAVRHAGLATINDRVPRIRGMRLTPAGEVLRVRVPAGGTVTALADAAEAIAAVLQVRDVKVTRDAGNAGYAAVSVIRRDPLAATGDLAWPHAGAERLSLWEPVPVGVDENGQPVTVSLPERNLLLGGEPGAGKSVALSQLVATAALDPACELFLLDGKLVELSRWAPCAQATAGVDIAEAVALLDDLRAEMDARYQVLLGEGRRKVEAGDGLRLRLVVVDELAHYLHGGDRKLTQAFAQSLRDLVSRGRAAGVIVVAATQKPSADVVPTYLRDLFGFRWALRCTTPQASDTVLGQGWASLGCSAADVDATARGVGWLLHEGGQPVRLRSYHLSDATLDVLTARAAALRGVAGKAASFSTATAAGGRP